MQTAAKEAMGISQETKATQNMYGLDDPATREYGTRCLIARRLVERGVRFVQLFLNGQPWDNHNNIKSALPAACRRTDKPAAALVKDLKQRGLLEDTLVIWGGEFGRTPQGEPRDTLGRDHHIESYSMWMAGGGVKGGTTVGETDELGYYAVKDKVHVHDLQATVLHLLGLDHLKLTYRFQGRDFRLTDVGGEVVEKLLA